MMARQLLESSMNIDVPGLQGEVVEIVRETGQVIRQPYLVTDSRTIQLENVKAGEKLEGVVVDVMGVVDGYKFALYLTDPERGVPSALARPTEKKCGVVSLHLDDVRNQFRSCDRSSESYSTILTKYLSVGIRFKEWIYHPRRRAIEEAAETEVRLKLQKIQTENQVREVQRRAVIDKEVQASCRAAERRVKNLRENQYRHYCLLCGHQWASTERGKENLCCPRCGKRGCIS